MTGGKLTLWDVESLSNHLINQRIKDNSKPAFLCSNVGKLKVNGRASCSDQNEQPDRLLSAVECFRIFTVILDVTGANERELCQQTDPEVMLQVLAAKAWLRVKNSRKVMQCAFYNIGCDHYSTTFSLLFSFS